MNEGCIPSKTLLHISHKYEDASKHFKNFGLKVSKIEYDWAAVMEKKQTIVSSLCGGIEGLFKKNKVEYVKGYASFQDKNTLNVKLN